jgi:hypothetical protein
MLNGIQASCLTRRSSLTFRWRRRSKRPVVRDRVAAYLPFAFLTLPAKLKEQ